MFFDYPLMGGSVRKTVVPGICRNTPASSNMAPTQSMTLYFQPVKIKQSTKEAEAMECDVQ